MSKDTVVTEEVIRQHHLLVAALASGDTDRASALSSGSAVMPGRWNGTYIEPVGDGTVVEKGDTNVHGLG